MKFVLDGLSSGGIRVGRILCSDGSVMCSPSCLAYTRSGALPHTTLDLAARLPLLPPAIQLSFSSLAYKPGSDLLAKSGCKRLLGLETFSNVYCSVQDTANIPDPSYNGQKIVSVWTGGQRMKANVADFMAFQEAVRPDWYESFCDTVGTADQVTLKRAQKSVERSLKFLDECIEAHSRSEALKETSLLGAVEGGLFLELRLQSAKETAKRPASGFVLEGFQFTDENQESLLSLIAKTVEELPKDKVRILHGPLAPHQLLEVMVCGIDVFDSSNAQPLQASGACRAAMPLPKGAGDSNDQYEVVPESHEEVLRRPLMSYEINLTLDRFCDDFSALSLDCTCPACADGHSRAYVHHLLTTHELLAPVLLMLHNLHQYYRFFAQVQELLQKGASLEQIHEHFAFRQTVAKS